MLLRLAWATLTRHRSRTRARHSWRRRIRRDAARHGDAVEWHAGVVSRSASFAGISAQARAEGDAAIRHRCDDRRCQRGDANAGRDARRRDGESGAGWSATRGSRGTHDRRDRARRRRRGAGGLRRSRRSCASRAERDGGERGLSARDRHANRRHAFGRGRLRSATEILLGTPHDDARGSRALSLHAGRAARGGAAARDAAGDAGQRGARSRVVLHGAREAGRERRQRAASRRASGAACVGNFHRSGDASGGRAAELLPSARADPWRRESHGRIPPRGHARHGLGERTARRDCRDASDWSVAREDRAADRARGNGDHVRRRVGRVGAGARHRTLSQLDSRVVSGPAGGDRLLQVRAARCVDRAGVARCAREFSRASTRRGAGRRDRSR